MKHFSSWQLPKNCSLRNNFWTFEIFTQRTNFRFQSSKKKFWLFITDMVRNVSHHVVLQAKIVWDKKCNKWPLINYLTRNGEGGSARLTLRVWCHILSFWKSLSRWIWFLNNSISIQYCIYDTVGYKLQTDKQPAITLSHLTLSNKKEKLEKMPHFRITKRKFTRLSERWHSHTFKNVFSMSNNYVFGHNIISLKLLKIFKI